MDWLLGAGMGVGGRIVCVGVALKFHIIGDIAKKDTIDTLLSCMEAASLESDGCR